MGENTAHEAAVISRLGRNGQVDGRKLPKKKDTKKWESTIKFFAYS